MKNKFTIDKARSTDDFDNMCMQPSDGGEYDAKTAFYILENGRGGSMMNVKTGVSYMVSYNSSNNLWVRKELKIK